MKDKHDIDSPGMADCLAMGEELPDFDDVVEINFKSEW